METKQFVYKNIKKDGTFSDGQKGAINTEGGISQDNNGSCGLKKCHCSNGHWITAAQPRTKAGVVKGIRFSFKTKKEKVEFYNENIIRLGLTPGQLFFMAK